MAQSTHFIFTTLLLSLAASSVNSVPSEKVDLRIFESLEVDEISNECGGVLTGDSGSIVYKHNVTFNMNERCVWVIRPGGEISEFTMGLMSRALKMTTVDSDSLFMASFTVVSHL